MSQEERKADVILKSTHACTCPCGLVSRTGRAYSFAETMETPSKILKLFKNNKQNVLMP